MKRRNFLKTTAASTLIANSSFAQKEIIKINPTKLLFFQTNWGFNGTTDQFCEAAKKEGYDGIELWWPGTINEQNELASALKKHQLQVGFLCGDGNKNPSVNLTSFKKQIDSASTWSIRPVYINCHAGKDFFSMDENQKFIEYTTLISKKSGINIYHETHRGRILFAAHITKQFIRDYNYNKYLKSTIFYFYTFSKITKSCCRLYY
jgi:sugar phosphate isomerase/epimerase